jgi:hydrogenase nickel incorporation protein HypA/HybF
VHELAICYSLLDQLQTLAREHGARRVERIELRIGPLSGVEAPLLANAWPLAAAGSIAEGAELQIDPSPVVEHCRDCGAETETPTNRLVCGRCGSIRTRLTSGDEMLLARVELSLPDEEA